MTEGDRSGSVASEPDRDPTRTVAAATVAALIGFAANSLLCRAALGAGSIDAASFTAIRIASGAIVLFALATAASSRAPTATVARTISDPSAVRSRPRAGTWASAAALFGYAAAFSFAYLRLTTATGALILFACVQATMIGWGVIRGARPVALEWLGLAIAAVGLVALTLPGLAAPDPFGAVLMASAGVCWGIYSLRGRGATRPLAATAENFMRAVPFAAVLLVAIPIGGGAISARGAILAVASGAIASGLGYSLWYAALPSLAPARAAILQLTVPVLAAIGGVVALGEAVSARLAGAAAAILGGVAIALVAKRSGSARRSSSSAS